jgi:hypothetical protein
MFQDKLVNPHQRFDMFASVGGSAVGKVKRRRRDGRNEAGRGTTDDVPTTEATAHVVN